MKKAIQKQMGTRRSMEGSEGSGGVGDGERAFQMNDVGTAESNLSFIKVSCFCPKFGNISILHCP